MTAKDRYGHEYVYGEGVVTGQPMKGCEPLISYNYVENDGWPYMNRGPERQMEFKVSPALTASQLEGILRHTEFSDEGFSTGSG